LVKKSDGSYLEDSQTCVGSGNSTMVTARNCIIPLTTLRTTFGLTLGAEIIAKARAKNVIGFGQYS
jgi:hypothetical protein